MHLDQYDLRMPYEVIAGIDEVGRGALAGPVVAGACILTQEMFRRRRSMPCWSPFKKIPKDDCYIADSKLLTPEEREKTCAWIIEHCPFGIGVVNNDFIERRGILAATNKAMLLALEALCLKMTPTSLKIDGRDKFTFPLPHESIIKGDMREPCIAAASIVAKVTRDRMMVEYHETFGRYGFDGHKGYGSEEHIRSLKIHGPCSLHRLSFLTKILAPEQLTLV